MIKTVGELKKAIETLNDNMLLDLYVCCYDRDNYTCIQRDRWEVADTEPLGICVSIDKGRLRIENDDSRDMELSY